MSNSTSVYMNDFEEEATAVDEIENHTAFRMYTHYTSMTFLSVLLIAICVFGIISSPYLSENIFIENLKERGGIVSTVTNDPSWMIRFTKEHRPNDGWFQTLWVANLINIDITDDELKRIAKSPRLQKLSLCSSQLSEEGILELVESKQLKFLELLSCKNVTESTIEKIKNKSPELRIHWRGESFVGVRAEDRRGYCSIRSVYSNSPASRAGISRYDRITKIDDITINSTQ